MTRGGEKSDIRAAFSSLRLVVEVRGTDQLHVQSLVDNQQRYVLPLRPELLCGGLALYTKLGRLHAIFWSIAYGVGPISRSDVISFSTDQLRYRETTNTAPIPVGDSAWAAAVHGSYTSAGFHRGGVELASVRLAGWW